MERAEPGAAPALVRQIGAAPVVVGAGTPLAEQLSAAGFTTVGRQAGLLFLQPPWPMPPHAVLVSQARAAPAMEAIAAARTGNALDDGHVFIETDVLPGGGSGDATAALVDLEVDAGVVRARANVTRPTWLVVREPYYPNWEATIDGRPTRIYPAAGFLLAVLLDAGAHEVRIVYHEPHLALGVILAVAAIVLLPIAFRHVLRPS
jgi:Bacterial membrane protein YfhO